MGDESRAHACGTIARGGEPRRSGSFCVSKDWIVNAQRGEYPFRISRDFGLQPSSRSTAQEWVEYAPKLSLIDQGILDKPCAPLLCVNGVNDSASFPIADMHLLLEHGTPKAARFYPGGHMGGGDAQAVIDSMAERKIKLISRWRNRQILVGRFEPAFYLVGLVFCCCRRRSKSCWSLVAANLVLRESIRCWRCKLSICCCWRQRVGLALDSIDLLIGLQALQLLIVFQLIHCRCVCAASGCCG